MNRIGQEFFMGDVLDIAPALLGKILVRKFDDGSERRFLITETEAYRGEEDLGCHASKGRTKRTEVMYWQGGTVYVYLIYGMYWMLNFVTSEEGFPAAVLIRSLETIEGPGRVGKILQLDKSFNGESLFTSERIWIEESGLNPEYSLAPRIGIDYAGPVWAGKLWRYTIKNQEREVGKK